MLQVLVTTQSICCHILTQQSYTHGYPDKFVDNIVMRRKALVDLKSLKFTLSLIQQKVKCATKSLHHHDLLYILNSFIKNSTWCVKIYFLNKWAFFNGNKLYLLIKQIYTPRHFNKYQTYWLILKIQINSLCIVEKLLQFSKNKIKLFKGIKIVYQYFALEKKNLICSY